MIENGLRLAIERDEFRVFYQPIKSAHSEETVGFEALLRWRRPNLPDIPPGEFIPIAEETGPHRRDRRLGSRTRLRRHRQELGEPARRGQLFAGPARIVRRGRRRAQVPGQVRSCRQPPGNRGHGIVPHQRQPARRRAIAAAQGDGRPHFAGRFRHRLFQLELPRTISVRQHQDRPLLHSEAHQREETRATVRAIIELASSFGMTTIAEGIETRAQLRAVVELGCAEAQGYLFSEPKPLDEIVWLTSLERSAAANAERTPTRSSRRLGRA